MGKVKKPPCPRPKAIGSLCADPLLSKHVNIQPGLRLRMASNAASFLHRLHQISYNASPLLVIFLESRGKLFRHEEI